jgi:hypothetical protein
LPRFAPPRVRNATVAVRNSSARVVIIMFYQIVNRILRNSVLVLGMLLKSTRYCLYCLGSGCRTS